MAKIKLYLDNQVVEINYAWNSWVVRAPQSKVKWLRWQDGCHRVRIKHVEGQHGSEYVQPWFMERMREVLRAQGKLIEVDVETMDKDELREKFEIVARSRRMREASFSITREPCSGLSDEKSGAASRRFIYDELKGGF